LQLLLCFLTIILLLERPPTVAASTCRLRSTFVDQTLPHGGHSRRGVPRILHYCGIRMRLNCFSCSISYRMMLSILAVHRAFSFTILSILESGSRRIRRLRHLMSYR
jgi:hypothetical protein